MANTGLYLRIIDNMLKATSDQMRMFQTKSLWPCNLVLVAKSTIHIHVCNSWDRESQIFIQTSSCWLEYRYIASRDY